MQSRRFSTSDPDDRQGRWNPQRSELDLGQRSDLGGSAWSNPAESSEIALDQPGAMDMVSDSERLALAQQSDPALTALHLAYDLIAREPGQSVGQSLNQTHPRIRQLFARHFNPQKLTQWIVDPSKSNWHRLTAMRVLEAGCPHWQHVRHAGRTLSIKQITWQLVCQCLQQHGLDEAVRLMTLVTDQTEAACRGWLSCRAANGPLNVSARIQAYP